MNDFITSTLEGTKSCLLLLLLLFLFLLTLKGRFLKFQWYPNFADLFCKLLEGIFYKGKKE